MVCGVFYVVSASDGREEAVDPGIPIQGSGDANFNREGVGESVLVFGARNQKVHVEWVVAQRAVAKIVACRRRSFNCTGILEPVKEVVLWNLSSRTETRPSHNNVPIDHYERDVNPTIYV